MSNASLLEQHSARPEDDSSSSSASWQHTPGSILVAAPETSSTKLLCGASLCIQAGRRGGKQKLGSIISARAFNLTEVGQAPGLEQEYAEEQDLPGGVDDCEDDISDDTSVGSDVDSIEDGGLAAETSIDIDDAEDDDCTTITVGTILEDLGQPTTPPSSTIGPRPSPQPLSMSSKDMDMSAQIDKAVHRILLKSIRDTAVLSTQSKKLTMMSASRAANSLFSFDSDQCDENYLQELLKLEF